MFSHVRIVAKPVGAGLYFACMKLMAAALKVGRMTSVFSNGPSDYDSIGFDRCHTNDAGWTLSNGRILEVVVLKDTWSQVPCLYTKRLQSTLRERMNYLFALGVEACFRGKKLWCAARICFRGAFALERRGPLMTGSV